MDLRLGEETLAIRDTTRRFAREQLLPGLRERDERAADPAALRGELFEMGFGALTLPEDAGGLGLGPLELALALEELAAVDASLALQLAWHNLQAELLQRAGGGAARRWLPGLVSGERLVVWAAADGEEVLRAEAVETDWRLTGLKRWVGGARAAGLALATARTAEGMGLFAVELPREGVSVEAEPRALGLRCTGLAALRFRSAMLPGEARLDGARSAGELLAELRPLRALALAAISLGLARGAFELALAYAAQREQFGRSIDRFEAIRFKLVEMELRCEALRGLLWRAAAAASAGDAAEAARLAEMAKLMSAETATFCAVEGVQIHGGYGYSREFHAERLMRDARALPLIDGSSEAVRESLAVRLIGE
jgi:alkylation response protein AidB-like acyl-CoA dehydrogenase